METRLGKIESVRMGHIGYQDAMFGIAFTLKGDGWGVGSSQGAWSPALIKHNEHTQWTEASRREQLADMCAYVSQLLKDAKVDTVDQLAGKPIEATFEGRTLKSWRLLTEVL